MEDFEKQKAVLVSMAKDKSELYACESSLAELERLLDTAGGETFCKVIQVRDSYDPRTCIGKGKIAEVKDICIKNDINLVIFDFELSPSQIRNIEEDVGVEVIDRTMLILDIFAMHAVSGEGKMQVELAQLRYTAPRLTGKGVELSRQEGRIGSRGPGESKLESDRRYIKRRISAIEDMIAEMDKNRATMRASRDRSGLPKIAIVGYTNAGKSTLLNCLTGAGVLAQDKLFATLDPTTRRLSLPEGEVVLLTDTVGLIRNLPHHLVKAFKSTLDEAVYADILMIVVDASDEECEEQLLVTKQLLSELNAVDKPIIYVYNKCDACKEKPKCADGDFVFVSAKDGEGIDALVSLVEKTVRMGKKTVSMRIPYSEASRLNSLYGDSSVHSVDYLEDSIAVVATIDNSKISLYQKYICGE
jgi:GTP-binding protein HflX